TFHPTPKACRTNSSDSASASRTTSPSPPRATKSSRRPCQRRPTASKRFSTEPVDQGRRPLVHTTLRDRPTIPPLLVVDDLVREIVRDPKQCMHARDPEELRQDLHLPRAHIDP